MGTPAKHADGTVHMTTASLMRRLVTGGIRWRGGGDRLAGAEDWPLGGAINGENRRRAWGLKGVGARPAIAGGPRTVHLMMRCLPPCSRVTKNEREREREGGGDLLGSWQSIVALGMHGAKIGDDLERSKLRSYSESSAARC
ncbi:hypothetical protein NL676_035217 [Syzygium grande]|nr:hypothetical protein NL676_035217 [Syzygium grande]